MKTSGESPQSQPVNLRSSGALVSVKRFGSLPARMRTRVQHRALHGFTLVELLVVVGIIATLIAILLPSLSTARRSAQAVACQANLRQIGLGIQLYSNDFADYLPAGQVWTDSADINGRNTDWSLMIRGYVSGRSMTAKENQQAGYERPAWGMVQCPAATESGKTDYGVHPVLMPYQAVQPSDLPHYRRVRARRSTETVLAADGSPNHYTLYRLDDYDVLGPRDASGRNQPHWYNSNEADNGTLIEAGTNNDADQPGHIRYRHGKENVANLLFLDGHVEPLVYKTVTHAQVRPER